MITTQTHNIIQEVVAKNAAEVLESVPAMLADPSKGPFYTVGALQAVLGSMLREFAGVKVGN